MLRPSQCKSGSIAVLGSVGLLFTGNLTAAFAEGAVSPDKVERAIQVGDRGFAEFRVDIDPGAPSYLPLDIVLVVDETMSMTEVIDNIQVNLDRILDDLAGRSGDVRFAVAGFADYAGLSSTPGCEEHPSSSPWRLLTDFTTSRETAKAAVAKLAAHRNGCDLPEAYLRALEEARNLQWRMDADRIVIVAGDAEARLPDPGRDGLLGTADDLDHEKVAAAYRRDGITVIGILAHHGAVRAKSAVEQSFRAFADTTPSGVVLQMGNGDDVAALIEQGMRRLPPPPVSFESADPAFNDWFVKIDHDSVSADGLSHVFRSTITPPDATPAGIYALPVSAFSGEKDNLVSVGSGTIEVRVGWEYYPLKPLVALPILLLTAFAIALQLLFRYRSLLHGLEFGGAAVRAAAANLAITSAIVAGAVVAYNQAPVDLITLVRSTSMMMDSIARVLAGAIP